MTGKMKPRKGSGTTRNGPPLPKESICVSSRSDNTTRTKKRREIRIDDDRDSGPLVGSTVVRGTRTGLQNQETNQATSGTRSRKTKATSNNSSNSKNVRAKIRSGTNKGVAITEQANNSVSNSNHESASDNDAAPSYNDDENKEDLLLIHEDTANRRRRIIPEDREDGLTEAQLNAKIITLVEAEDTQIPTIMHNFNYKSGESKQLPPSSTEHLAVHLTEPDNMIFLGTIDDKPDAKAPEVLQGSPSKGDKACNDEVTSSMVSENNTGKFKGALKKKEILNQFSFDDRTTQTNFAVSCQEDLNVTSKEIQTDVLPISDYLATVSRATIYKAFVLKEYTNNRQGLSDGGIYISSSSSNRHSEPASVPKTQPSTLDEVQKMQRHQATLESEGMAQSLCIIERMINRNQDPIKYDDYHNWGEPDRDVWISGHEVNNQSNEDGGFFGSQVHGTDATGQKGNKEIDDFQGDSSVNPSEENFSLPLWEFNMFQHDYQSAQYALHSKKGQSTSFSKVSNAAKSNHPNILNQSKIQDLQLQTERPPVPHLFKNQCFQVTALCWNARFPDLFAVGFGSQDFLHRDGITFDEFKGAVCCCSLKNSFHPEYRLETNSAVTCLDFYSEDGNCCRFEGEDSNPFASLIAVGCFDGTVLIYDYLGAKVNNKSRPLFKSSVLTGCHQGAVWQMTWERPPSFGKAGAMSSSGDEASPDAAGGEGAGGSGGSSEQVKSHDLGKRSRSAGFVEKYPRFFSVSGDGRVAVWTIRQSALCMTVIVKLSYPLERKIFSTVPSGFLDALDGEAKEQAHCDKLMQGDERNQIKLVESRDGEQDYTSMQQHRYALYEYRYKNDDPDPDVHETSASGSCFDFHPIKRDLFLVGTEEGNLHLCSQNFKGQYLQTFEGHAMRVNNVQWNYYHENLFISCSEDKTAKLWDSSTLAPLKIFDSFKQPVSDVTWSPHSSTIFAAVAGRAINVFDLTKKQDTPLAEQKNKGKKNPLTRIRFSPFKHVLLLGCANGIQYTYKVPTTLRAPAFTLSKADEPNKTKRDRSNWAMHNKQLDEAVYGKEARRS